MSMAAKPVLAIDLGGTKTLLGLVSGGVCGPTVRIATPPVGGPPAWLDAVAQAAAAWRGGYTAAAIAVSGLVANGCWWAVNPAVLPVPPGFPLLSELQRRLGVPAHALNDAQAAAWGEFRFGAGRGCDLVFVTVSTGIGAGIVLGGRLLTGHRGLAGHLGQYRSGKSVTSPWLEQVASGSALARDTVAEGAASAERLTEQAAGRIAAALVSVQALLDPDCIVIGGGLGLAPGFLERLRRHMAGLPDLSCPDLREAALGPQAGLLGVADFGDHAPTQAGGSK